MSEVRLTEPPTDDRATIQLAPEDYELMRQLDVLLGITDLPGLPPDMALRLLDFAWNLLEGDARTAAGRAASSADRAA